MIDKRNMDLCGTRYTMNLFFYAIYDKTTLGR